LHDPATYVVGTVAGAGTYNAVATFLGSIVTGGAGVTITSNLTADSYVNKVLLQKSLASDAQFSNAQGIPIAGNGTVDALRDASRLAATYGGNPEDWIKMSSTAFKALDGFIVQTHWYENQILQILVEFKSKIR
jgi:hypothetical protein